MKDREFDSEAEARSHVSRQDVERRTEEPGAATPNRAGQSLLRLQRLYGNRYVQRVVAQAKQDEGEAEVSPGVEEAIERARGGGQPLDSGVRAQMEPAFGADFSGVRVHADAESDALNRELNARAFTTGQDVFFRQGAYDPGSSSGRELLAHELTHVVQQAGGTRTKLAIGEAGDQYEQQADQIARFVGMQAQGIFQRAQYGGEILQQAEEEEELQRRAQADKIQRAFEDEPDPRVEPRGALILTTGNAEQDLESSKDAAENMIVATHDWLLANWRDFIGLTSSNPTLSWSNSWAGTAAATAFGSAVGHAVKKVATPAAAGARAAAAGLVGTEVGGPLVGLVAWTLVMTIEAAGHLLFELVTGKTHAGEAAAQAVWEATQQLAEIEAKLRGERDAKLKRIRGEYARLAKRLSATENQDGIGEIHEQAVKSWVFAASRTPSVEDRSLFKLMLHDWILEHAGDEEDPESFTDPSEYSRAVEVAKEGLPEDEARRRSERPLPALPRVLERGPDLDNHPEIFAYQTRRHWKDIGLVGMEYVDPVVEHVNKIVNEQRPPDPAMVVMGHYDRQVYPFRSVENPELFIRFLKEAEVYGYVPPEYGDKIRRGQFLLECQLDLSSSDGSVYVNEWEYTLTFFGDISWFVWMGVGRTRTFDISPD